MSNAETSGEQGGHGAVRLELDAQAALGECPRWSVRDQVLYWVDISEQTLNRFDPVSGDNSSRVFEEPVACFSERSKGGFVLAMRNRFALIDHFDAMPRWIGEGVVVPDGGRFNDGRCDQVGRFLAGTIDFKGSSGALHRINAKGVIERLAGDVRSANGLAFSPDGRTMYWSDTRNLIVRCWDYDSESGEISHTRTFTEFKSKGGRPDGASVDTQGCYWSALYDGGRVVRFAPDGKVVEMVTIPSINATMIAFGGSDMRTAFVTTARQQLSDEQLRSHPHSGGIFSFRVPVPGIPEPYFAG
ncbi:SMP-30/gluconolactonase/LRE family protein [Oleiagrimonas sp.]|jgi:sugar lactone lactonase YvrE|uniref:SMP-30/gluconolactonase/LRE family protein n=1 Tax=Oleiagrimonas sp. TaxID=2010330 RepID=UPI002604172F|nr:SMP-30/gluconolactonase/LRE family protein [Oleiagrimonas sp.]MDA3913729.1 SMP-30/gluconolactonase/LRE family protein [Oleiagrimonas sp.]